MTKIFLIRHGQTEWNNGGRYQGHSDIPLSEEGKVQAKKLSLFLNNTGIHLQAVYASDLSRAQETAEIIAAPHQVKVENHPGFREINFGVWEGLNFKEIKNQYPDLAQRWLTSPEELTIPQGESFKCVQKRAKLALDEITQFHQGQNIAIVSHGGTLRALICELMEIPLQKMWHFKLDNTALSSFDIHENIAILSLFNSTYHL
jgi:alpha-ribazole phosphatase